MVNCAKCGKKIGLLGQTYDYEESDGTIVKYCSDCNKDCEKDYENKKNEIVLKEKNKKLKIALQKNDKYEYKILNLNTVGSGFNATGNKINPEDERLLNQLGSEGWELVSATGMNSLAARLGASSTATEWVSCIFKRKI